MEPTNKDANTSWRDADLNRTIKREEEDEDFDRVNHNIQITGADTKTGKIDYHKIPVDRKAKAMQKCILPRKILMNQIMLMEKELMPKYTSLKESMLS